MTRTNSVNFSGLEKYVVDQQHPDAPYSTIQAAVNAASATAYPSVVYILPGVYVEDVTLSSVVSLCALGTSGQSELVKITGRCLIDSTASAFNTTISGITFQTTAPFPAMDIQGANPVSVQFEGCAFRGTLNTAVSIASTGSSDFRGCKFTASAGQKIWDYTSDAVTNCFDCSFVSTDTPSTVNSASARLNIFNAVTWVDSFNVTVGIVALKSSLLDPIATLPVYTFLGVGFGVIVDSVVNTLSSTSGFVADGAGFFVYSGLRMPGPSNFNYVPVDPLSTKIYLKNLDLYFNPQVQNTSTSMQAYNSYIVTSGTPSFALPTGGSVSAGTQLKISMYGGTSWTITQAGGQSIRMGTSVTTIGVGGSLSSTADGDCVTLDAIDGSNWVVTSSMGSLVIV